MFYSVIFVRVSGTNRFDLIFSILYDWHVTLFLYNNQIPVHSEGYEV